MVKTLISTLNDGASIPIAAHKLAVDKMIILVNNPISAANQQQIDKLKTKYEGVIELIIFPTSMTSLKKVAEDVVNLIDSETRVKHDVFLHTCLTSIPQTLGIVYSGYVRPDTIVGIYAVLEDAGELIQLPLIDMRLEGTKKKVMVEIKSSNKNVKKIASKLRINQSMVYAHLKDLVSRGFLTKSWELTDNGYIAVL